MDPLIDRREFAALLGTAAALLARPVHARAQPVLRLVLLAPPGYARGEREAAAARGVLLGVEEAARTGALFGRSVVLEEVETVPAAERLLGAGAPALLAAADAADCARLGAAASAAGAVFVNLACRDDALRRDGCGGNTLHVEASAAMYADALEQFGGAEGHRAVLWHGALQRYGAGQLNERFRARHGVAMDGPAWAGWFGVKALWEAALRARTTNGEALLAHLGQPTTRFDGHKGWPLSFRTGTRQLRQPLYILAPDGRHAAEVPAARGPESRRALDTLGPLACER